MNKKVLGKSLKELLKTNYLEEIKGLYYKKVINNNDRKNTKKSDVNI
jgi:hypothetical protein